MQFCRLPMYLSTRMAFLFPQCCVISLEKNTSCTSDHHYAHKWTIINACHLWFVSLPDLVFQNHIYRTVEQGFVACFSSCHHIPLVFNWMRFSPNIWIVLDISSFVWTRFCIQTKYGRHCSSIFYPALNHSSGLWTNLHFGFTVIRTLTMQPQHAHCLLLNHHGL